MSRLLNDLAQVFKPIAFELLARTVEVGIPVLIVNTRRTAGEQAIALSNGSSQVAHSKHQDGLAIDLCPYSIFQLYGDDKLMWRADDPIWQRLGLLGEQCGLVWGGRWLSLRDMGHFEYVAPAMLKPGEPTGKLS